MEGDIVEAENKVLGRLKVSGSNVSLIFVVFGFIMTCVVAWMLFVHMTDTKDASKEFVGALKESAQAAREQNCLISLPQDRREQNAEVCKRISR